MNEGDEGTGLTYRGAGVDVAAADQLVSRIAGRAASTRVPGVLGGVGGFGSLFALEEEGVKITLKREPHGAPAAPQPAAPLHAQPPAAPSAAASAGASEPSGRTIDSPMVGTFYRAPSPESPPFVNVGDRVSPDTVLCIIEAMKVMNEIKAETEGVITEVLAENGKPVQFGEPMFRME